MPTDHPCPAGSPQHAAGRSCHRRAALEAQTRLRRATSEIDRERRRQQEVPQLARYRNLVHRMDGIIQVCEQAHLNGISETPGRLSAACGAVLRDAVSAVETSGNDDAMRVVRTQVVRPRVRIIEVMDAVWMVEEVLFDLMVPWRSKLPKDVELTAPPVVSHRQESAA